MRSVARLYLKCFGSKRRFSEGKDGSILELTAGPVKGLAGDKHHTHLVPLSTLLDLYGLRGSQTTLRAVGSWRKDRLHWPSLAMRLLVAGASNAAAEVLEPGAAPVVPLPGAYPCAAQPAPAPPAGPASP
jgi:hypothetical protein